MEVYVSQNLQLQPLQIRLPSLQSLRESHLVTKQPSEQCAKALTPKSATTSSDLISPTQVTEGFLTSKSLSAFETAAQVLVQ